MVAGKHAQSAAIDRHAFHQPVLHRKIRDQPIVGWLGTFQIAGIAVARPAIGRQKSRIRGRPLQGGLRHPSQHQDRIVAAVLPQRRIQPAEQRADRVVPTPQHVIRKIAHSSDRRRQSGPDKEFLNRLNLKGHGLTSDSQIYHRHKRPNTLDAASVLVGCIISYIRSIKFSSSGSDPPTAVPSHFYLLLHRQAADFA